MSDPAAPRLRYEPLLKLATGGMATVFVGTLRGDCAFQQLVALKRPHPHLVEDPEVREQLLAEARVASRIRHANVVDVRDVEAVGDSIQLVMDYIEGASLGELITRGAKGGPRVPSAVAVRIALDACAGLHAAHELTGPDGAPLGLVHRDVSPQNILVGADGVARVTDFGVAKDALSARPRTTTGELKGKVGYFAPEYVRGQPVDRRADVFALGVVLWEALAHKRLFRASNEAEALDRLLRDAAPPVSTYAPEAAALDAVMERALAKNPADRYPSARAFGDAIESAARRAGLIASHAEVAQAVTAAVGDELEERRNTVRERLAALETIAISPEPRLAVASPPVKRSRTRHRVVLVLGLALGLFAVMRLSSRRPPAPEPVAEGARDAEPAAASPPDPPLAASSGVVPAAPPSSAGVEPHAPPRPAPVKRGVKPLPANPYR